MRKIVIISLLLIILLSFFNTVYAQGLKFKSMDYNINDRTSLNVFDNKKITFSGQLDLKFDFSLHPPYEFGYLLRIINGTGKEKRIWNVSLDAKSENTIYIRVNEEGKRSLMQFSNTIDQIKLGEWHNFNITFDLVRDSLYFRIDSIIYSSASADLPDKLSPVICFGRSDHIIDVPNFAISVNFPLLYASL